MKEKVPKIKENIHKGENYEKVPYGCLCVSWKPLFQQSDLNQVSLINGDGNLQCTAVAKCNNLYETFIFLY